MNFKEYEPMPINSLGHINSHVSYLLTCDSKADDDPEGYAEGNIIAYYKDDKLVIENGYDLKKRSSLAKEIRKKAKGSLNKRLCHNKQLINSHFYRGVSELPYKLLFAVIYTHLEFRYEMSHTITSHHVHHFHQTRIPDGTLLDYMVQYRKPLFPQFFLYPKKFLPENNPHHKEFHLRPYIQNNANQ